MNNENPKISEHAIKRMAQRGIRRDSVEAIFCYADRSVHCGGGCRAISVTWRMASRLVEEEYLGPRLAERIQNIVVVVSSEEIVVSVYPRDRRYNRAAVKRTKSFHHRRSHAHRRRDHSARAR